MAELNEIVNRHYRPLDPEESFEQKVFSKIRRKKRQRRTAAAAAAVLAPMLLLVLLLPLRQGRTPAPVPADTLTAMSEPPPAPVPAEPLEKREVPVSDDVYFASSGQGTNYVLENVSMESDRF